MATKHKRATMTARQLAEDYLAHQITRDVTRTSTRYHLNQLLALFGGWQARRVGAAQMQEFLAAQKARGVMATTAHHRVRLWRTVLAWAVETGRLPMGELAAGSGTDKKTMERHRKYLVAILLAFTNGYEIIRGHLCQIAPAKGGGGK